jgi:putative ABC transport system permease protein
MKRFFRRSDIRADAGRDVGDELRFHMDMRTQEFIEAGLSPEDARRAAEDAFGNVGLIDDELRTQRGERDRSRDRRDRVHELSMDVLFAVRTFRKNLGFTAAALATLALGVGATTAVFTVVNGVLLRPLPYADPSRLAMIWMSSRQPGLAGQLPVSSGFFTDAAAKARTFESMAAFRSWSYALQTNGDVEQISGARVTPSLFIILGIRPALGQSFTDTDAAANDHLVLIGYALWQRAFGGSSSIVGRRIDLSGEPFTVIGVMPPAFAFPRGAELTAGLGFGNRTELWTPLVFSAKDRSAYGTLNMAAIGRLRAGSGVETARGELSRNLHAFLMQVAPRMQLDYEVVGLKDQAGGKVRRGLMLLMGAVGFVLFIACANVTNLLVARTTARRRELSLRAALGAGRGRIARQLVTENVMLAAVGTALGLGLSIWATRAILSLMPGSMPRADDVGLDWRVALACVSIAIGAGAIFGAISTMQVRLDHLATTLRDAGRGASGGGASGLGRRGLVIAEVSLSVMLVVGAGLLTMSFARLQSVEPGFAKGGVLTAGVVLPLPGGFNPERDGPGWSRFYARLDDRIRQLPGVRAAGAVSALPLTGTVEGGGFAVVGQPQPAAGRAPQTQYAVIDGDYFGAAGIRLVAGRTFDRRDGAGGLPVAIVTHQFVRRFFPDSVALDRQLRTYFDFAGGTPRTIVGVVDDARQGSLDGPIEPLTYVPEAQMPYPGLHLVIRTTGEPLALLPAVKRELKQLDPSLAITQVRTLENVFDDSLARQRLSMTLLTVFAGLALLLAVVGLYGVIALSVGRRTREIGVRMALGARPADVIRLVVGEGLRMTTIGIVAGLIGAFAVSRVLDAMLFGVTATDLPVYVVAAVSVLIITLSATFIPARRATLVDPTSALRAE